MAYHIEHKKYGLLTVAGIVSLFVESAKVISNAAVFTMESVALMTLFCLWGGVETLFGLVYIGFVPINLAATSVWLSSILASSSLIFLFWSIWRINCTYAAAGTDPSLLVICFCYMRWYYSLWVQLHGPVSWWHFAHSSSLPLLCSQDGGTYTPSSRQPELCFQWKGTSIYLPAVSEALLYYCQHTWLDGGLTISDVSSEILIVWQQKCRFRKITSSSWKRDVVLHLNVVWRGIIADKNFIMDNEGKDDGWRV